MTAGGPRRRRLLQGAGALVLMLGARDIAFGATILAVRVWPAADYTRVTIESDTALAATHFTIADPQRVVIDVDGLELSPTLRELVGQVEDGDPYIARVRVGQNRPRVVRLVIDLKQASDPQVFTLEPVAAYRHRLVFDLYPTTERDPLLALLQEKAAADGSAGASAEDAERAASAVADALGEFIGKIGEPGEPGASAPAPHCRRARPRPWRRRPGRYRPERLVREGRGAADRPAAAQAHQRPAEHARDAHP